MHKFYIPGGNYVLIFDPLDGSSNIDVNVTIGTIFSIYRRVTPISTEPTLEDILQKGSKQVVAGYFILLFCFFKGLFRPRIPINLLISRMSEIR
ncbi:MAG: hypothetical protein HXY47_05760 [Nitrospirae bacterium]|nr:hypothetical protein [Nitrospirota bacterium]